MKRGWRPLAGTQRAAKSPKVERRKVAGTPGRKSLVKDPRSLARRDDSRRRLPSRERRGDGRIAGQGRRGREEELPSISSLRMLAAAAGALLLAAALATTPDHAGCIVKHAALHYSQQALRPPRHGDRIRAALGLDACPAAEWGGQPQAGRHPGVQQAAPLAAPTRAAAAPVFYVDAAKGSDSATGTSAGTAFLTMQRAQTAAQGLGREGHPVTVHLLPGATHYLSETLTLSRKDSFVSWVGDATVAVSGAVLLPCQGKWQRAHTAGAKEVFSCQLPVGTQFDSLFVGGLRQKKARYPNGDSLLPGNQSFAGYDTGCTAQSWWDVSGAEQLPVNLEMVSRATGARISQGSILDAADRVVTTVEIDDRDAPRTTDTSGLQWNTTGKYPYNPSFRGTRFNETYNLPFWVSSSPSSIKLGNDTRDRSRRWKDPAGAILRMLHPAGWGGWAFEVESIDSRAGGARVMKFTKGGTQEARGSTCRTGQCSELGAACGPYYVEGLREVRLNPRIRCMLLKQRD